MNDNVVIPAARAAGGEGARPPRFVVGELVQIERIVSGLEAFPDGPCDIEALTGLEATVEGAMPVAGAWAIAVSVADRLVVGFPEDTLRSTGMVLVDSDRVPRERVPELAWRDDILISLHTDTQRAAEAELIAETVAERLSDLNGVARVQTQVEADDDWPLTISVWLNAHDDCLHLAASVIGLTDRGWDFGTDEDLLLSASWVSDGADFLAPEVSAAELVYRRWSTPERRSWSELTLR